MLSSKIDWPSNLVNSIARRRTIIVIGSGVSKNSKNEKGLSPNSWKDFLIHCSNRCETSVKDTITKLISEDNYLMACELIKRNMDKGDFAMEISKEYLKQYKPADIHEHIFNLDLPIIITPNFDCIYDTYSDQKTNGTVLIKSYYDDDIPKYIRGDGNVRLIIKSHGTAKTPERVIFTNQEYVEARTKYALFYDLIKALALTHTFLFIGCGINDPDIKMVFEDIRFSHGNLLPKHYMTVSSNSVDKHIKEVFQEMTNIGFLEYNSDDNHAELTYALENLSNLVDEERENLAKSRTL